MIRQSITVHMIVKNEEKWIWYAIMSVIDFVDEIMIFDTGSTDNTVKIIKSIYDNPIYRSKLLFEEKRCETREEFIILRQEQVKKTKTDYFLIVDGDEIWYKAQIEEVIKVINTRNVDIILSKFLCCAGDIYHYRSQERETYMFKLLDGSIIEGAVALRGLSMRINGIHCGDNEHTNDGYYNQNEEMIDTNNYETYLLSGFYLHMSYLQRSSSIINDSKTSWPSNRINKLLNQSRYDGKLGNEFIYPEVFYLTPPQYVSSPWQNTIGMIRMGLQLISNIKNVLKNFNKIGAK